MHRAVNSLGLVLATLICWLYAYHLYVEANHSLYAEASDKRPATSDNVPPSEPMTSGPAMDDSSNGILTFVHASDLHISKYVPQGGLVHFQHFLHTALPLISPRLVVVTGDLTDGKDRQRLRSQQQIEEWRAYEHALEVANVTARFNGSFYRDQRGNHDCFNIFDEQASENLYSAHSAVRDSSGYFLQIREPFGEYAFVASDACPRHGFSRPLNFFGALDASAMALLEQRLDAARSANHTFLLNHYPVSTTVYGRHSRPFAELVRGVSVVLCGHLHELVGGLGTQLQAFRAHEGYWELELGDMKEHAVYRVYAVDNDLISFVDVTLPLARLPLPNPELLDAAPPPVPIAHPPVVLVTNPKDARYLLPAHEPLHRMRSSRSIRMLIWADQPVKSVEVRIDGILHSHAAEYRGKEYPVEESVPGELVKIPLWAAPWDPTIFEDGRVHQIEVTVVDTAGKRGYSHTPFTLGDTSMPLGNGARGGWIMRQNFADMLRISGTASYLLISVCLLLAPRICFMMQKDPVAWVTSRAILHHQDHAHVKQLQRLVLHALRRGSILTAVKLTLALVAARTKFLVWSQFTAQVCLAGAPWLFWPAYFFAMSIAVLPLFVGRLIPSAPAVLGSVYTYGIFIAGEWSPLLDSWTYALATICSLGVLLLYLAVAVTPSSLFYSCSGVMPWYRRRPIKCAMAIFVVMYLGLPTLMTAYAYGWVSVLLGFGRAWLVIAACLALYWIDWQNHGVPPHGLFPQPSSSAISRSSSSSSFM
ncbi:hypothetical protein H4R24_003620 [Coemansia sp. RSA 988]|nr:hypothetical protein H4R24_003620 [Coemansia sp. RSA 988]